MPTILLVHSTMESVDTACSFLAMRSCIRSWAAANACTCGRNTSTWMEYDWHVPLFAFVERLRAFQHGQFAFSRNPRHSCSHNDAGSDGMAAAAGPCGYAALRWLHRDPSVPSQRAAVWPRVAWHRRCATCRTPLDLCCCACTAGTGSSGNPLNSWQDFGWLLLPTDMCTSTAAAAATCRRAEVWSTCVAALPSGCCASAVPAHMHTGPSHGGSRAHTHTGPPHGGSHAHMRAQRVVTLLRSNYLTLKNGTKITPQFGVGAQRSGAPSVHS